MTPNLFSNRNEIVLEEDRETYEKLFEVQVHAHQELLKEQSLYDVEISPTSHLDSFLSYRIFVIFTFFVI